MMSGDIDFVKNWLLALCKRYFQPKAVNDNYLGISDTGSIGRP
jgi:hypothetical protein